MGEIGHFGKNLLKCMKFHIEQAGLWLKPNSTSQLKPVMPQADTSNWESCLKANEDRSCTTN